MDPNLYRELLNQGTDIQTALSGMAGNEELYIKCLDVFTEDKAFDQLTRAISEHDWEKAYSDAHKIKGNAGYMGFMPLFHSAENLMLVLRNGQFDKIILAFDDMNANYQNIVRLIKLNKTI